LTRTLKNLKALVLAAGSSSRIRAVSGGLPKPLIKIEGQSILEHNLKWLAEYEITLVWINLHYGADNIRGAIGDGDKFGLNLSYSEEPNLMGTAGALKLLEKEWPQTTLVIYGDNLTLFDLREFVTAHQKSEAIGTIALFDKKRHPNTGIAGGRVIMTDQGRIEKFTEGSRDGGESPDSLVNAGVYLLEREILQFIPIGEKCDFAYHLFPRMLKLGKHLQGYIIDGFCLGVDTPECYRMAVSLIKSGKVKPL